MVQWKSFEMNWWSALCLECWRSANVTAIPKGAPSPGREYYQPISITPIVSMVYQKLVSLKLSCFCVKCGSLPAAQFAYGKSLGCTDSLLTISHHLQKSLDAGMESNIIQVDFSAAFDRVSHSNLNLLVKVAVCFLFVQSFSLTIGRES